MIPRRELALAAPHECKRIGTRLVLMSAAELMRGLAQIKFLNGF
jgi:hypothetical protein